MVPAIADGYSSSNRPDELLVQVQVRFHGGNADAFDLMPSTHPMQAPKAYVQADTKMPGAGVLYFPISTDNTTSEQVKVLALQNIKAIREHLQNLKADTEGFAAELRQALKDAAAQAWLARLKAARDAGNI